MMIKKIGLYFGSFNPPTIAHVLSAYDAIVNTDIEKAWFVVASQNPHKSTENMASFDDRVNMMKLSTDFSKYYEVFHGEKYMSESTYTFNTIRHIKGVWSHNFALLMGDDIFYDLDNWYRGDEIFNNEEIYVLPREHNDNILHYVNGELIEEIPTNCVREGSATEVRNGNLNLVFEKVKNYIQENNLYN